MYCRICYTANLPRPIFKSHNIGDPKCTSLSLTDRNRLIQAVKFGSINAEEEDDEDGDMVLASKFGYEDSQEEANVEDEVQVNIKLENSGSDKQISRCEEVKLCRIQPFPTQILTVFIDEACKLPIHIDMDSGASLNYIRENEAIKYQFKILPNTQMSTLGDGKTKLKACGEIDVLFSRNSWTVRYRAVVSKDLQSPIIGGTVFMTDNKIQQDLSRRLIHIHDKQITVPETNELSLLPIHPTMKQNCAQIYPQDLRVCIEKEKVQNNLSDTIHHLPALAEARRSRPTLAPARRSSPALAPARRSSPALAPARRQNPALAPARRSSPTLAPATRQNPALDPARRSSPALVPARRQNPALAPAEANSTLSTFKTVRVLLPGQNLDIPVDAKGQEQVAVESWVHNKNPSWPQPQLCNVVDGMISIHNSSEEPVILGKDVVQIKMTEASFPAECSDENFYSPKVPSMMSLQQSITQSYIHEIQIGDQTEEKIKELLNTEHAKHSEVFNKDLTGGYNDYYGYHRCHLNWASNERPSATKVKVPNYNHGLKGLQQELMDSLTEEEVLLVPQEHDIIIQAVCPSFLQRKQRAKNKAQHLLTKDDVRLLINFGPVNDKIKPIPAHVAKTDDVLIMLGRWKELIIFDLYNRYFQIKMDDESVSETQLKIWIEELEVYLSQEDGFR